MYCTRVGTIPLLNNSGSPSSTSLDVDVVNTSARNTANYFKILKKQNKKKLS